VAAIDNSCVGCGNCGEVAEAAILCPSFYRADVIHNPTRWDTFKSKVAMAVIGWLQRRRDRRRPTLEATA
jgi:indolepyruvate ferredoxin oxidoreductase alpha subunit